MSSGESNLKIAQLASDLNVNNIIVGLSFVVVTVIELTKIPLASVFYYAGKIAWRVTFFLALLAVNFLTFETIMQGFELAYNQRSEKVDDIRKQVEIKRDEIANIETKADLSEIDFKIEKVNQDIKILVDQKKDIEIRIIEEKTKLIEEAQVANPNISRLQNSIENKIKEKEQYENQRRDFVQQRSEIKTGLFSGSKKKIEALDLEISKTEEKISNIDNELSNLNNELAKATNAGESRNESKIRSSEEKANLEINSLNKQIEDIQNNQLKPLQDQKSKNLESSLEQEEKRLILNDELTELQKELKEEAKESQIYRIAIKIKVFGEFISGGKLEDQLSEIDEEILDLEKSKFKKSFLFFWERDYVPSDAYIKLVDNKILVLQDRKNEMLNQVLSDEKKEIDEADLSQKDVDRAFWIWFGSMALVISIIGSLVALAGFHLQDERMHEIRNRPVKERFRRFFRNIAWIPVYINRYIWAGIKRLTKPKIVEKVVEVEKEVEKIVEKNIGEKIVYEKVEFQRSHQKRNGLCSSTD